MRRAAVFVTLICVLSLAVISGVYAQVIPSGDEFQVNTETSHDQQRPDVAALPGGGFVVVWESYNPGSFASTVINGQRYDSSGSPVGGEFQITGSTWYIDDHRPKIDVTPSGGEFVVVWDRTYRVGATGNGIEIMARRMNAAGTPAAGEILVTDPASEFQIEPAVAVLPNGDFIVVWNDGADPLGTSLQARRFNAAGIPQGVQFRVDGLTGEYRNNKVPAIGAQSDNDFVVVWESELTSPSFDPGDIYSRLFNSVGMPLESPYRVNMTLTEAQEQPDVAVAPDDSMIVVWGDDTERFLFDTNIFGRRLLATGGSVSGEFLVNTVGYDRYDADPSIDSAPTGVGFVVSWTRNEFFDPTAGVVARVMEPDGSMVESAQVINTLPSAWGAPVQDNPVVVIDDGARVMVSWDSAGSTGDDSDGLSVAARHFSLTKIFFDGFESGNLTAWSVAVP